MNVILIAAANLLVLTLPAHLLAYYPFRARLRIPFRAVMALVLAIQALLCLLYGWAISAGYSGTILKFTCILIYAPLYFCLVLDDRFKVLFLYIFVTDYLMIVQGVSAFLEVALFPAPEVNFNSWSMLLLDLLLMGGTVPLTMRLFSHAREQVLSLEAPFFWRIAWILPGFTTLFVMLFAGKLEPSEVYTFRFLFARGMLLLSALIVYYAMVQSLAAIRRQGALEERAATQERLLNLQKNQRDQLLRHVEEIRSARHDLRQHLRVLHAYLDQEDLEGMRSYLESYEQKLPADTFRSFAENFALNAVCTYYGEEARKYGIAYDAHLTVPKELAVSEPEVCAILGNLLENAVEACRKAEPGKAFIRVRGVCEGEQLVFTVDNTCAVPPVWEKERLLSDKHEGYGIGTWSIQSAAERSGGTAQFEYKDGIFYASVLVYDHPWSGEDSRSLWKRISEGRPFRRLRSLLSRVWRYFFPPSEK